MPKFTDRYVAALKPGDRRQDIWDTALPSFGVRLAPSGRKTWIVAIRAPGRSSSSRIALGHYPAMSLGEARAAARARMADPGGAMADRSRTVADVLAEHIRRDQQGRGRRSWQEVQRALELDLKPWAQRPVTSITRRDVVQLINGIVDRGSPSMARRVLSHIKRLFAWCVEQSMIEASPAASVRSPGDATKRERVLTPDELAAVLRASDGLGWPAGPIVRLLALTGQRLGEVAGMEWAELDLQGALWTIPAARMKGKRQHEVPLSQPVLELINSLPQVSTVYVFPARTTGPTRNLQPAKAKLDLLSGVTGWTLHDLRRTAASGMARLGVAPHIVAEVLGHARSGVTTTVYVHHSFREEKRAALEAWAVAAK